ncbi:hypothetical protein [Sanyastnella coralliicola]|uniref:hypothetical protein n=1 Tax=Sanyastnella coralliicola TaxID=3069118 RepID=UPI0027B9E6C3|nr:hypothetical protein [Longitalea sp. SCSIO 12813]
MIIRTIFLKVISSFAGLIILHSTTAFSQSPSINNHVIITNDLSDSTLTSFIENSISKSQFIVIGEEHGYSENNLITEFIFDLAYAEGYRFLGIETDSIAAKIIERCAKDEKPQRAAEILHRNYPFSIPFYNSPNDYTFFENIVSKGGQLWGVDQSFMTQFRLNFSELIKSTDNETLKNELTHLETEAHDCFKRAIDNRNFQAPFIFRYSDSVHTNLINLCNSPKDKRVLQLLKTSKDIYSYNFTNQHYENNLQRSNLMKMNFLHYYRDSRSQNHFPKVVFKLGGNHTSRGLNSSNICDLGNLLSETAFMNGMSSVHITLQGIKGEKLVGNPFSESPSINYDNSTEIPPELVELILNSEFKYFVLDLAPLRQKSFQWSEELTEVLFKYDIIIYVNNTTANNPYH